MHTEHYSKKNIHCNKLSLSFILYLKEYYLRQTWFLHRWYLLLVFFLIGKYFLRVCSPVFSAQQQQKKRNEPSGNRFGGGDCTHRVSTPRGALPCTVYSPSSVAGVSHIPPASNPVIQSLYFQSPLFLRSYANMHVKKMTDPNEFNQTMCRWFKKDKIKILKSFCSNLITIKAF